MATASVKRTTPIPPPSKIDTVTLVLSEAEARVLAVILSKIGGLGSARSEASRISDALGSVGIDWSSHDTRTRAYQAQLDPNARSMYFNELEITKVSSSSDGC